jgi:hypothetical protein
MRQAEMDDFDGCIAALVTAGLVRGLAAIESPPHLRCAGGMLSSTPVYLVTETAEPTHYDTKLAFQVCIDWSELLQLAAQAVDPSAQPADWREWDPEITFTGERGWLVRFAELTQLSDYGVVVRFEGLTPVEVDHLEGVEGI